MKMRCSAPFHNNPSPRPPRDSPYRRVKTSPPPPTHPAAIWLVSAVSLAGKASIPKPRIAWPARHTPPSRKRRAFGATRAKKRKSNDARPMMDDRRFPGLPVLNVAKNSHPHRSGKEKNPITTTMGNGGSVRPHASVVANRRLRYPRPARLRLRMCMRDHKGARMHERSRDVLRRMAVAPSPSACGGGCGAACS